MTDHPRFQRCEDPPAIAHRAYHGGPLVDLVFRLVDWWWETPGGRRRAGIRQAAKRTIDAQEPQHSAARLSYLRRRVGGLRA
jgi:hypothetical protein